MVAPSSAPSPNEDVDPQSRRTQKVLPEVADIMGSPGREIAFLSAPFCQAAPHRAKTDAPQEGDVVVAA